ncbi:hypothetical protein Tco_0404687 [Tanacetum coccineum]
MQTQEDHSNPIPALNVDSLKVDLVVIQNTCSEKEDSNSETTFNKPVKESSLNYETKDVPAIKYKMSNDRHLALVQYTGIESTLQRFTLQPPGKMQTQEVRLIWVTLVVDLVDTEALDRDSNSADDNSMSVNDTMLMMLYIKPIITEDAQWLKLQKTAVCNILL